MKYIIIVDNNTSCGDALKALLQFEMGEERRQEYMVATSSCAYSYDTIESVAKALLLEIKDIYTNYNEIHFLIDLLLTKNEERKVDSISDKLIEDCDNPLIASGIELANKILKTYKKRITISFMSKWLNLQNGVQIDEYNGIKKNPLWENHNVRSFLSPINEEGCIINRTLQMPQNRGKTVVAAAVNIAFDF